MSKIHQLCLIVLLLISEIINAENIHLQVKGLTGALKKNVQAYLSTIENSEIIPDQYFCARVDNTIREALKALGYYEPTIKLNLYPSSVKKHQLVVIIHVSPGKPILISHNKVLLRSVDKDQDYLDLLATLPKKGTVLNHGDYDHFKKSLVNIALHKGYFDSKFIKNQLNIVVKQHEAFWDIDYEIGKRYRLSNVIFEGSQINDKYLQNLIPFKIGDYYHSDILGELNRRLSATGWFNSVVVAPEFDKVRKNKTLSLHGIVSPCAENIIETGVGYSTDSGPRLKMIWKKPWINSCGHSLISNFSFSMSEQQLGLDYKIPLIKNPLNHYYLVQGNFKHTNFRGIEQESATLAALRYWGLSKDWRLAINLHLSFNRFIQANTTNISTLLYPSLMISRTRSYGHLMQVWGDSQQYSIDYSNSIWGSDIYFFVIQSKNVWIRTYHDKHRFIMRSDLGWIETDNLERIPPDLRFFAGGDHSIRGYKYKSISPENEKGQKIGALKLVIGSLEYQYNSSGKWWGAVFIDSGEAVNNFRKNNFKTGMGIGTRWQSPIGAIKLDFAMPVSSKNNRNLKLYIGLGPEL